MSRQIVHELILIELLSALSYRIQRLVVVSLMQLALLLVASILLLLRV